MAIRIPIITTFDKRGVDKALSNINGLSRQAGKAAGVLAGGVAVGIGASVREFAKFDEALNQSLAIMGDVTDTMRGEMSDAAREVAKTTTFSAEQAAESFFFLASAGLDAEQSVAALPQVASFAQAGMFDMATATDLATDAQSALGLASDDAGENLDNLTRVTDVFVAANTLANTSVEQLATALTTKAGNALKTVGKDVEEGAAALAVFADQGIKGERAGTLLTNTIFGLTDRVEAAPEEFEKLGLSIFDSDENMRSFADISEQFTEVLGGMTKEQQIATISQLGFTKQSREGLLALVGQSEALTEYEQGLRNAGGTAQEVANNQLDTFNAKLSLLGSAVTDVALEIGGQMAPKIEELIGVVEELLPVIGEQLIEILDQIDFEQVFEGVAKFFNFIADNIKYLDELIVGLAAFAVGLKAFTTAITIARIAATAFGATLTVALGPIGLISAALGALGVVVGANALANQDMRSEQEKLTDELNSTRDRLEELRIEQAKNTNTSKLYQGQIDELEEKQRELKGTYEETTGEVFEYERSLRNMGPAGEVAQTSAFNLRSETEKLKIEFHKASDSVRINNDLLIANATLEEAQQRHVTASRMGRHKYTKTLMDQIKIVTEENRLLLETGSRYAETTDAVKNQAGNLTYLTDQTTQQTTATGALSDAQLGATGTTSELAGEITNLNNVMADGQKANSDFLDLMHGIEDIDAGPSVGDATRQIQGMITELAKADKLIRQEGGLFEFMQGGANVTAEFDEQGNLLSAFTDPGETPVRSVTGETVDINAINKVFNSEFGPALQDFAGSNQAILDSLLGQTSLINPESGMERIISGGGQAAIDRALEEGFQLQDSELGGTPQDILDTVKNIGKEIGVDVALGTGGIVMKPTRALIGEAGPEAVLPLDRAGGFGKTQNTININVSAGVGSDPVSIGREVVDAIKRYESVSGRVFASA